MKKKSFLSKPGVASVVTAFAGVVVLMIIFAIMNPNFIKSTNLMTLTRSICPYLLVGIGQGIVTGEIKAVHVCDGVVQGSVNVAGFSEGVHNV